MSKIEIEPKILGQLLLMQSIVINLPDISSIFSFVCSGLKDIPGISDVHINSDISSKKDKEASRIYFPISQNDRNYGELVISLSDKNSFIPYDDYLKNFIFMLGIILEERTHRHISEQYKVELEQKIKERTSELKLEKENLIESQRRFNDLMSNVTLLSVMLDNKGNIIFCNNFLLHVTGYTNAEIIHKNWFDIFIKKDIRGHVRKILRKISEGMFVKYSKR